MTNENANMMAYNYAILIFNYYNNNCSVRRTYVTAREKIRATKTGQNLEK